MLMPTINPTVRAAAALVENLNAAEMYDALSLVVRLVVKAHQPVTLTGEAAIMTPLLDLAVRSYAEYERVLDLVDDRRTARGLPPLRQHQVGFDKDEYQRVFMNEKRRRQRRAVEIENDSRPPRDRLIGRAREEFMRVQGHAWFSELTRRLDVAREAHGGGRVPKDVLDTVRSRFWAEVDARLEAAESRNTKH